MTAAGDLFTVRVAAPPPGKGGWRVVVRAEGPAAAAERVAARGHRVLSVEPGCRRHIPAGERSPPALCLTCGYDLKDLPPDEGLDVLCPECGSTNQPDDTPALTRVRAARRPRRTTALFAAGFAGIMLAAMLLRLAGW